MSGSMVQSAVMHLAKSSLGVIASNAIDLPSKVNLGDSFLLTHASNGVINFAISDLINYFEGRPSKVLSMDVVKSLDDIAFFGAVTAGVEVSDLHTMVFNQLRGSVNLSRETAQLGVQAGILSASRIAGDYIDENATTDALKILRHPFSVAMSRVA